MSIFKFLTIILIQNLLSVFLVLSTKAFPTGGFSHSMGSEAAVQYHQIRNKGDIKPYILSCLENTGSSLLPYVKVAHEAFQDIEKLEYLDDLLNASLLNHVAQRASKQQGKAFLTTCSQVFLFDEIVKFKDLVEEGKVNGHLAIAFPVVCAALKIPDSTVGQMFLFNSLRTLIASLVRLGKIGAVQAQQYQFEIQNYLDDILERGWKILPEDSYISFPLTDTIQNLHDTMFSKLFYS